MQAARLQPVVRSVEPRDLERLIDMDKQLTGVGRRDWYQRKLAPEPGALHVSIGAEVDGLLVGAILGSLRQGEFGVSEPIAVIDTILVDRRQQGKGIATCMLEQLARNLRAFGVQRLRTELSWDDHQLNGFLSRRGFAPSRRTVLEMNVASKSAAAGEEAASFRRPAS